ncbi:DUF3631 domain-containing protein [Neisseriaceae bacterium TC5R-5]|nr:DUF3631 domain-containing protein [Neisseriaceae bacterium TC5R-5]
MTPIDSISQALSHLDAHDRVIWWRMAMAVKSELGEAGFSVWDSWSQSADNYQPKAALSVWKSIKQSGGVTIASLFAEAIEQGYRPDKPYQPPTKAEQQQLAAAREVAEAVAEAAHQAARQVAKDKAHRLWHQGSNIRASHPYLIAKGITPYGIKQLGQNLLIPLQSDGELINLQILTPDGRKRFLTGGQVKGASLVIGKLKETKQWLLCEGWATACSLHAASGLPVIIAFNAHNLVAMAERLQQTILDPDLLVLICADCDSHQTGQQAASKAASLLPGRSRVVLPHFTPEQQATHQQTHGKAPSDFNDLHQLAGLEQVQQQLEHAITQPPASHALVPDVVDENALIRQLAKLSLLDYGRQRKAAAETLGNVPMSFLDKLVSAERKALASYQVADNSAGGGILFEEVEPWPQPVNAAVVLDQAYTLLSQYVIADKETLRAATLWAAMSWFADYATVLPLAVITAPEKGCGKSTLLMALSRLVCRPLYAANITPAALFRAVEAWKPTLMIDEADTFAKDNEELRGVLNAGHTKDTAKVVRVVEIGGELQPRAFSVWGAKALSGIGKLPETIMSRAIVLSMRRKMKGEQASNLRHAEPEAFHLIKCQFARWAEDCGEAFAKARPVQEGLSNRNADNWEPLFALADLASAHWPKFARQAAFKLSGDEEDAPSLNEELLRDIRAVFDQRRVKKRLPADKMGTTDLLEALCADEEAPWLSYNRGRPLTARQLSKRLGDFGIKPKTIREGIETKKGYELEQFSDAFTRYLDGEAHLSVTASQTNQDGPLSVTDSHFTQAQTNLNVTRKPLPGKDCDVVTDKNPHTSLGRKEEEDYELF